MKSLSPTAELILEEIGFGDIPSGWQIVRIEDLLAPERPISVGVMYPGEHVAGGVPLVKAGDLNGNRINSTPAYRISSEKHHEYRRTELSGGELLISLVGEIGRCAVVPSYMRGWNVARAVAVLRFKDPANADYVRFCLLSDPLQHLMNAWATTTVQATLNLKEIRQLPLPWPSDSERRAISSILGALDDKIELNRRMNATLEALARAIFQSWFVDFDPVRAKAEGRETGLPAEVAALFPDGFVESELGEIPKGWTKSPLPLAIEVNPQRSLRKGAVAPYLDMANMPTDGHTVQDVVMRPYGSGTRFANGDTLVARITPCLENGKTAYVDFLEEGQIGWGSTEYIVLRPKEPLPTEFGYCLARHPAFRDFAIHNMTGSSGRQRVPVSSLSSFWITLPEKDISEEFGRIARPLLRKAAVLLQESRVLSAIRNSLLPKLISGQLRVTEAVDNLIHEVRS